MPDSRGRPVLRTVAIVVAAVLVVVLVVAVSAAVVLVRRPFPAYQGEQTVDGLRADVEIIRDRQGVPHIYADDARDLFRAQGYVHAQDRFFEMDYRRRVGSGRLAELLGPQEGVVEADTLVRTLGWRQVAEQELETMTPAVAAQLEAYADGVNDYISGREASRLGLEYTVLGLTMSIPTIEPWSAVDSLVWLKALAWDLSNSYEAELERAAMFQVLEDVAAVEELFPEYPEFRHAPVLGPGASGSAPRAAGLRMPGQGEPEAGSAASSPAAVPGAGVRATAARVPSPAGAAAAIDVIPPVVGGGDGIGSNSWVVAGELTETGGPLVAVDPHTAATVPGVWYQVGLHCRAVSDACPYDVTGVGFAGMPGVVSGHTADLAWGMTSLPADVTDFFLERVFDDGTYLRDGQRAALERRTETMRVNGAADVRVEVVSTVHGPIVSDVVPGLADVRRSPVPDGAPPTGLRDYVVALGSAALQPGRTLEGILALNRASSPEEVRAAADLMTAPTFSIVYATTAGDIGYEAAGLVPQRATITGAPVPSDGRWPRPGWESAYDWQGFVAPADLPGVVNPRSGYIVAANQAVQPGGDGPFLGREWDAGYRAERIATLIEDAAGRITVERALEIQHDVVNPIAALLVPYLLTVDPKDDFVEEGVALLRGWDLEQSTDTAAAAYFAAVWANLLRLTFWDDVPEGFEPDGGARWLERVRTLVDDPQSPWWDDRTTINVVESRDEVLIQALTNARLQLTVALGKDPTRWSWSKLHRLAPQHPVLGGPEYAGPVSALVNPEPRAVDGGNAHVWATAWDAREWEGEFPTFDVATAPSMRMVMDLADLDASRWVNLTGMSGHAGSPHYTDQLGTWVDGETYPWVFAEDAVRERAASTRWLRALDQG